MFQDKPFSDVRRKLAFIQYNLFPFKPRMVARHIYQRSISLLGLKKGFRVIDLAVTYKCNLHCVHCSAAPLNKGATSLSLKDYQRIADSAEKDLGVLSWNLTGGEPLLAENLEAIIQCLHPKKNYITIQTNTTLMTLKKAKRLAKLGVNCITTSLDSIHPKEHNAFRGMPNAFQKTLRGIGYAKKAGMQILIGGTVTHQNLRSPDLIRLIKLANKAGAIFLFNLAVPCGRWRGNVTFTLRGDDRDYLDKLMIKYPLTTTDHEMGRNAIGCPAGKEKIYITAYGEVVPCPFIHVTFGNVKTTPLKQIVKRMQRVNYFSRYYPVCLAGENQGFYQQVMKKIYNGRKLYPAPAAEIFKHLS